jgi:DNA (cytosine-5)-methyltransferase 1
MAKFNFVGLYSGCGGADIGFEENGFRSLGAFDINSKALEVHKKNIKRPIYNVDLTTFEWPTDIKEKKIDVVFSGAPCQGFSTAGRRLIDDPRNNLLVKGGQIAISLGTKVFVSENVMGSFAGLHKKYWDTLNLMFKENGYKTQFIKVNCLDIGMAQMRKRILFFAWNGSAEEICWPKQSMPQVLGDVLEDVENQPNNEGYILSPKDDKFKIATRIKERQKLCNVRGGQRAVPSWDIPEVFGKVTNHEKEILLSIRNLRRQYRVRDFGDADPVNIKLIKSLHSNDVERNLSSLERKGFIIMKKKNYYDLTMTFNGKYRRLSWTEACPTVDTRFGNPIYFLHPEKNRGFTVREAARIQGFDDDFIFEGSLQEQFKMIGNAVPPPLSRIVASLTKEQLLKNR